MTTIGLSDHKFDDDPPYAILPGGRKRDSKVANWEVRRVCEGSARAEDTGFRSMRLLGEYGAPDVLELLAALLLGLGLAAGLA